MTEAWNTLLGYSWALLWIPWFFVIAWAFGMLGYRLARRKRPHLVFLVVFSFLGINVGHYLYNLVGLHDILTNLTGNWLIFPILSFDLDWGWPWMRATARSISIPMSIIGIALIARVFGWMEDRKKFVHLLEEM